MREIKFRGLSLGTGIMVFGSLINYDPIPEIQETEIGEMDYDYPSNEVIPETVGQYIGLKDKNGVEIYEGDVTKDGYVIMFCTYKALFAEFFQNGYTKEFNIAKYPIDPTAIEIIGNIHENPELLNP